MKLLNLDMYNFMPYRGDISLAFAQGDRDNVTVIFGDNMRGKTSILNAIRWAFYGKALGRHLQEIPRHLLLNKEAKTQADWTVEVRVRFEANGHTFDLRRRATKKKMVADPSRPEDLDEEVGLQKDGLAVRQDLIKFEINQIAPEQISRFFLFDGELLQEYETLLIEGSAQGRKIKDAIEQILGVPALTNGRDEIQTIRKNAQKKQTQDLKHVKGLEAQAEQQYRFQQDLASIEDDIEELSNKLIEAHNKRVALDDEL